MRRKLKQSLMKNMWMVTVQMVMKRWMSSGQLLEIKGLTLQPHNNSCKRWKRLQLKQMHCRMTMMMKLP